MCVVLARSLALLFPVSFHFSSHGLGYSWSFSGISMRGVMHSLYSSKGACNGLFILCTMNHPRKLNVELSICVGRVCFGGSLSLLVGLTFANFYDKSNLSFLDLLV